MLNEIKWDVFTKEEKDIVLALVARQEYDMIAKAIMMDSSEKEYWVTKILEEVKPIAAPLESKVQKDLIDEQLHGKNIETPEQEAEWQKKIEEEKTQHEEKVKAKRGRPKKTEETAK